MRLQKLKYQFRLNKSEPP